MADKTKAQLEKELKEAQATIESLETEKVEWEDAEKQHKATIATLEKENKDLSDRIDIQSALIEKKQIEIVQKKEAAKPVFDVKNAVAQYFEQNPKEAKVVSTPTRLYHISNKTTAIAGAGKENVKVHTR